MENEKKGGGLMTLARIYGKFSDHVISIEEHFITIATLVFGVFIIYNIFLRATGKQGLYWIEEGSRYMLVVTTMIGCSIAARLRTHMVMDTVVTAVPIRLGHILRAIAFCVCAAMYLYMGKYAIQWTLKLVKMKRGFECNSQLLMWPIWAFYSYAVVVMGWRYVIEAIRSIYHAIIKKKILSAQDEEIEAAVALEAEREKAIRGGAA